MNSPAGHRGSAPISDLQRFSHHAMAAIWEIVVRQEDHDYAAGAAAAAFETLDCLEQELSRFIENSDLSRINHQPVGEPLRVGIAAFRCIEQGLKLRALTGRAFDCSAGALWKGAGHEGERSGMGYLKDAEHNNPLLLDGEQFTVVRTHEDVVVDLGGIAKGFAVEVLLRELAEWDIDHVLVHGGASTAKGAGAQDGNQGWEVSVSSPGRNSRVLKTLRLHNRAVGGSGLEKGPHIIDPRTGRPADKRQAAWAMADDAAAADAFSTAFMVMGEKEIRKVCKETGRGAILFDYKGEMTEYGETGRKS